MKSIFSSVSAGIRNVVQAVFASAEDPRKTSAYAYKQQYDLLLQVRQALADLAIAKDHLKQKIADVQTKLPALEGQARDALVESQEDLARLALQRRQIALTQLQALEEQAAQTEQEGQRLIMLEQRLSTQIEAYFARQELLTARYNAVEKQSEINDSLQSVSQGLSELEKGLARVENRTSQMQARASAIAQYVDTDLMAEFDRPEALTRSGQMARPDLDETIDKQIEMLRRSLEP